MPEGARTEVASGLRGRGRSVPAKRARGAMRLRDASGEHLDRLSVHHGRATTENAMREGCYIEGGGEEPCVSGDPCHDAAILVVHFSLDDAIAEFLIVNG